MKIKSLIYILLGLSLAFTAQSQEVASDDLKSRIQPLGKVHIAGAKAETTASGPRTGKQIYSKACIACHSSGVLGAPKFQNADDWAPRISQGFDTMWQHAIKGFNAMPAKGTCSDCTDDEIKSAIEHMIEGI